MGGFVLDVCIDVLVLLYNNNNYIVKHKWIRNQMCVVHVGVFSSTLVYSAA